MSSQKIFILDLFHEELENREILNQDQKIFSVFSTIIYSILNLNSSHQIGIISVKNGTIEQNSHMSGNLFHHIQGLYRVSKTIFFSKTNVSSGILLAKKLFFQQKKIENQEIILVTKGKIDSSFFHSFGGSLIKDNIKFSVISLGKKIFTLEILTKLTGGFFFVMKKKNISDVLCLFKSELLDQKKKKPQNPFFFGDFQNQFFFSFFKLEKKPKIKNKLLKYCSRCKSESKETLNFFCNFCNLHNFDSFFFSNFKTQKIKIFFNNYNLEKIFSFFDLRIYSKRFFNLYFKEKFIYRYIGKVYVSVFPSYLVFFSSKTYFPFLHQKRKKEVFCTKI